MERRDKEGEKWEEEKKGGWRKTDIEKKAKILLKLWRALNQKPSKTSLFGGQK